jgi:hypothetical protein
MSKFTKVLGVVALALVLNIGAAEAAWHGGHGGGWHGGGWHGGGWGYYGGGFAAGAILGGLLAAPYYAGPYYYGNPGYYYGAGDCGWVRVRVLRYGHWVVRRAWRCW